MPAGYSHMHDGPSPEGPLYDDALAIMNAALKAARPDEPVQRALRNRTFPGKVIVVAVGKAAYSMAHAAYRVLGSDIERGFIVSAPDYLPEEMRGELPVFRPDDADRTYDHLNLPRFTFLPSAHPVPSEQTVASTRTVLSAVQHLSPDDTVIFLLSGGASSLFEDPLVPLEKLQEITRSLLAGGADINQINAVRKRLSGVKAGRFAQTCAPAQVLGLIVSDVPGNQLDAIGSGPTCPDTSTCAQARQALQRCGCVLDQDIARLIDTETPDHIDNAENILVCDATRMAESAAIACRARGYAPIMLNSPLTGEARHVGTQLAQRTAEAAPTVRRAWIGTGETTVQVRGGGRGGRNQEVALAAAIALDGCEGVCVMSVGSDGRDGPTDAAGGWVCGSTAAALRSQGIDAHAALDDNDAYPALAAVDGLIITGETGTNVADFMLALRQEQR